jgi:hypothetical protein
MTSPAIIAIKRAVAAEFGVTVEMLDGRNLSRRAAWPRHVAMYLARHLTNRSSTEIGHAFGGRDHTTVLGAVASVAARVAIGDGVDATVERLSKRLRDDGELASIGTHLEVAMFGRLEMAIAEAEEMIDIVKREMSRCVDRLAATLQRERAMVEALRRGDA